jgi:hypothetical protein
MVTGAWIIVEADVDGLNVVAREELAELGVDVGDLVLRGHPVQFRLVDVARGHDLGAGELGVGADVVLADLPDADDAETDLLHAWLLRKKRDPRLF